MRQRKCAVAAWHPHIGGTAAPLELRHWLTDRVSLTVKLVAHGTSFRVQRLAQQTASCLADEHGAIGLPRRMCVQERDVLLVCDGVPVVFAHTVVPLLADASDWPFFSSLGERSLGTTLFGDPLVQRGPLQYSRLPGNHPLALRARRATGVAPSQQPLYARRCLFRRKHGVLLVTEVFLPAIAGLTLNQSSLSQCRFVGGRRFNGLAGGRPGIGASRV
jgi:chorismate--pyruvate lyase